VRHDTAAGGRRALICGQQQRRRHQRQTPAERGQRQGERPPSVSLHRQLFHRLTVPPRSSLPRPRATRSADGQDCCTAGWYSRMTRPNLVTPRRRRRRVKRKGPLQRALSRCAGPVLLGSAGVLECCPHDCWGHRSPSDPDAGGVEERVRERGNGCRHWDFA
jgi:hypothetical protein